MLFWNNLCEKAECFAGDECSTHWVMIIDNHWYWCSNRSPFYVPHGQRPTRTDSSFQILFTFVGLRKGGSNVYLFLGYQVQRYSIYSLHTSFAVAIILFLGGLCLQSLFALHNNIIVTCSLLLKYSKSDGWNECRGEGIMSYNSLQVAQGSYPQRKFCD